MTFEKLDTWLINLNPWKILYFLRTRLILLLCISVSSALVGYSVSFLMTPKYISKSTLLLEQGMSNVSFGVDPSINGVPVLPLSERTGAIRTNIYPSILKSTPFALSILKIPVTSLTGKSYGSLREYLNLDSRKKTALNVTSVNARIKTTPAENTPAGNILELTPDDELNVDRIFSSVQVTADLRRGTISIETVMDDPMVAAKMTSAAADYLRDYVTKYRTEKTRHEVDFLMKRVAEAQSNRNEKELALQRLRDNNRNIVANIAQIEEHRLQSNFLLAQTILTDLTNKLEQAKIKLKEEQPIFTTLEPTNLPNAPDHPKRIIMAGAFSILAFFLTIVVLAVKVMIEKTK